jgi:hypothetical protein
VHCDRTALAGEEGDRVGQVELTLRVVGREPFEDRPELVGSEDVDRRVDLAHRELLRRRVGRLDDLDRAPAVAENAPVLARVVALEREDRRGGVLTTMGLEQVAKQRGGQERRVAREHEDVAGPALERPPGAANGVAGPAGLLLDHDLDACESV